MKQLSQKTALVTGASAPNGIGRAIAKDLASNGATVVVADIEGKLSIQNQGFCKMELLSQLAEEIECQGGKATALELDVTNNDQVVACIDEIMRKFGGIDILVNNAGSLAGSSNFLSTDPDQWRASFEVNILGPMMLCQAVIPEMQKKGGGRIINIGSTGSLGAEAGFGAYTAMKHGLKHFGFNLIDIQRL